MKLFFIIVEQYANKGQIRGSFVITIANTVEVFITVC